MDQNLFHKDIFWDMPKFFDRLYDAIMDITLDGEYLTKVSSFGVLSETNFFLVIDTHDKASRYFPCFDLQFSFYPENRSLYTSISDLDGLTFSEHHSIDKALEEISQLVKSYATFDIFNNEDQY